MSGNKNLLLGYINRDPSMIFLVHYISQSACRAICRIQRKLHSLQDLGEGHPVPQPKYRTSVGEEGQVGPRQSNEPSHGRNTKPIDHQRSTQPVHQHITQPTDHQEPYPDQQDPQQIYNNYPPMRVPNQWYAPTQSKPRPVKHGETVLMG